MASPEGQVLFSLVIPPHPPSSAKHLSDRNLPVMLAQSFPCNLYKASIHNTRGRQTGSLPVSEERSRNLEKRGFLHQHGATGWYLMKRGRDLQEVSISNPNDAVSHQHGWWQYPAPLGTSIQRLTDPYNNFLVLVVLCGIFLCFMTQLHHFLKAGLHSDTRVSGLFVWDVCYICTSIRKATRELFERSDLRR